MVQFRTPQYIKKQISTGFEAYYKFMIDITLDECVSYTSDEGVNTTLLQQCLNENMNWWNTFLQTYLNVSSKHFAKSYTVDAIKKHIKNIIIDTTYDNSTTETTSVNVTFIPKEIIIHQGTFIVNWIYILNPLIIDIPDLDEEKSIRENVQTEIIDTTHKQLPEQNEDVADELHFEELPMNEEGTEDFKAQDMSQYYEKQRVKEAKLRAKLAYYKAQRQVSQYYDKYGKGLSDSDSSDSDDSED